MDTSLTMQAFVLTEPGAPTIELAEVPVPDIDDDQLLVRVHAVGVGIHDSYFLPADARHPYPIGIEAAGVVERVGASVTEYAAGDRIAFVSSMQPKGGTWAEFVAVSADSLILPVPDGLDFARAAAVPVAGNTIMKAFRALDGAPQAPARPTLFIAGGSGAIGTLGIQLAHARGWQVAASASAANHEYMASLGADLTVDYHDPDWRDQVLAWAPGGTDAAIAVQPGTSADSIPVVRDGGVLVSISGDSEVSERGITMTGLPYSADVHAETVQLLADVAAGRIHVELEQVYPFASAPKALAKVQTRRARGKVVLSLA